MFPVAPLILCTPTPLSVPFFSGSPKASWSFFNPPQFFAFFSDLRTVT